MKINYIKKAIAAIVLMSISLVACKKTDTPVEDKSNKLLFNWKITNITTPKVAEPGTDSSIYKSCMGDDLIKFTAMAFDFQDGATKCDSSLFYYSKGNWALKQSTDSLQLTSGSPTKYISWKILTLNDSILQVRYTDSANLLRKITKTISFKH